jgi:hypothetical protein
MGGDGGVDKVAAEAPEPSEGALLVGAGEAAISDDTSATRIAASFRVSLIAPLLLPSR